MKVLVLVHGFPPHAQGGSEIYADTHARALNRVFGHDVLVLTREIAADSSEYAVRREDRDGFRVVWINNTFRKTRSFAETYRNDAIAAIAARVIDEFQPDVAHVHHLTGLSTTIVTALRDRRVPVFVTLHDYWFMCHRGQLLDTNYDICHSPRNGCDRCIGEAGAIGAIGFRAAPAFRALERRLPPAAANAARTVATKAAGLFSSSSISSDHLQARLEHMRLICGQMTCFLAPSRHLRDRFIAFGIDSERIREHGYGFETGAFNRVRRETPGQLRLGFLGSLMVSKAPHLLLEAAAMLRDRSVSVDLFGAPVAYHGDEGYRQVIDALTNQPDVRIHGPVAHDQVPAALSSIDVLVVPSIWPENSPLVIREAFLAGIPVIASRIGGIPEIVEHERNGLLFEPGSATDLAHAIERLLNEPALYGRLRQGIPAVRTIEDDVAAVNELYDASVRVATVGIRPRTAAIVLNYNTPDDTFLAVHALLAAQPPLDEVIVIDHSANDDLAAAMRGVGANIHCIRTGGNRGFSAGMNTGIQAALAHGADRIALVNSDVIVPPDCFARLERRLQSTPHGGIAGPLILSRSTPDRIASAGISYLPAIGRMRHRLVGEPVEAASAADAVDRLDAISGCVMYIKREVIDAIGLLPEDYFYSFEDVDFCLQARRAGFDVVLDPAAVVYHEGGRSIGADDPRRLYFAARNHLLLARRLDGEHSGIAGRLRRFGRTCSIVALNVAHACRTSGSGLPVRLAAVARGVADYMGGRFGEG